MDFQRRMYWPNRGLEAAGERRTSYGNTLAVTAYLSKEQDMLRQAHKRQVMSAAIQRPAGPTNRSRMLSRRSLRDYAVDYNTTGAPKSPSVYRDSMQKSYKSNVIRGLESNVPLFRDVDSRSKYSVSSLRISAPHEEEKRLRLGRAGGTWRHVREIMQSKGERLAFVDGTPCLEDRWAKQMGLQRAQTLQSLDK